MVTLKALTLTSGTATNVRSVVNVCGAAAELSSVTIVGGGAYGVCCNNSTVTLTHTEVNSADVDKGGTLTVGAGSHIEGMVVEEGSAAVQDTARVEGLFGCNANAKITVEGGTVGEALMSAGSFAMAGGAVTALEMLGGQAALTGGTIGTLQGDPQIVKQNVKIGPYVEIRELSEGMAVATVNGKKYTTLADAVAAANANPGGTIELLQSDVPFEGKIEVTADVTIQPAAGVTGVTITRKDGSAMFDVAAVGKLTLAGVSIDGGDIHSGVSLIKSAGELVLTNTHISKVYGTEVGAVLSVSGTTTITDSSIKECTGDKGGVALYAHDKAKVTLTGSAIENNTCNANDGNDANMSIVRVYHTDTVVTMESGSISNNSHGGNGVVGIYDGGKFVMEDGSISGNTYRHDSTTDHYGSAVHVWSGSTFEMNNGSIVNNKGGYCGGATSRGSIVLNGGTIDDNTDLDGHESAVYALQQSLTIGSGMTVNGSAAVCYGNLTNSGTINGDVYLYGGDDGGSAGRFDNTGGTVTGKVYVYNAGEKTGTMTGNEPNGGFGSFNGSQSSIETEVLAPTKDTADLPNSKSAFTVTVNCVNDVHDSETYWSHAGDACKHQDHQGKLLPGNTEYVHFSDEVTYKNGKLYSTATIDHQYYLDAFYQRKSLSGHHPSSTPHKAIGAVTIPLVYQNGKWVQDKDQSVTGTIINAFCSYTVTWDPANGRRSTTKTVTDVTNGEPAAPAAPYRSGYIFTGWAHSVDAATGNVTYTAQWRPDTAAGEDTPSAGNTAPAEEDVRTSADTGSAATAQAAPAPAALTVPAAATAPAATVGRPARTTYTARPQTTAGGADDAGDEVEIDEDETPLAAAPAPEEAETPGEQPGSDVTVIEGNESPLAPAPEQAARSHRWLPLLLIPVALGGIFLIILLWRKKRKEEEQAGQ